MDTRTRDDFKRRLMVELMQHVGRPKAISMVNLNRAVFGDDGGDKINGTRLLRKLITELREEGTAICSGSAGYYLAAAGSERQAYTAQLVQDGLKKMRLAATIEGRTLPALLEDCYCNLEPDQAANMGAQA